MTKARLNYSINLDTAEALDDYCASTGRKAADVARQVVLDYLDDGVTPVPPNTLHPKGRRADIWMQHTTLAALDAKTRTEGHASRSALVDSLLCRFLNNRQTPKFVPVTINVPLELWNQIGPNPEEEILRAITAMPKCVVQKECV